MSLSRRRVLLLCGGSGTVVTAGCTEFGTDGADGETGSPSGGSPTRSSGTDGLEPTLSIAPSDDPTTDFRLTMSFLGSSGVDEIRLDSTTDDGSRLTEVTSDGFVSDGDGWVAADTAGEPTITVGVELPASGGHLLSRSPDCTVFHSSWITRDLATLFHQPVHLSMQDVAFDGPGYADDRFTAVGTVGRTDLATDTYRITFVSTIDGTHFATPAEILKSVEGAHEMFDFGVDLDAITIWSLEAEADSVPVAAHLPSKTGRERCSCVFRESTNCGCRVFSTWTGSRSTRG